MNKTKLLFVIQALGAGGAEKALISLLNYIDYDKYEVDLQLFFKTGVNLKFVPKEVNILPPLIGDKVVSGKEKLKKDIKDMRFTYLLKKSWNMFLSRVIFRHTSRQGMVLQWKSEIRDMKKKNTKHYDVAIGYMQGPPTYYVSDCVNASRKLCWYHIEYSEKIYCPMEGEYFKKFDKVLTISPICVDALKRFFPELNNVELVYNMNCPELIKKLSNEGVPEEYNGVKETKLVSVGRLCYQKGFDIAIDAAKILKDAGYKFKWYILGKGKDKEALEKKIIANNLENEFHLLGIRENPYVYIKNADIVLQTSRFEGKSIVLDEAKILEKPIVCTKYNSVNDQLEDNVNAVLTPITAEGIAEGIKKIIDDENLKNTLVKNLSESNINEIKFENEVLTSHYKLFDA